MIDMQEGFGIPSKDDHWYVRNSLGKRLLAWAGALVTQPTGLQASYPANFYPRAL